MTLQGGPGKKIKVLIVDDSRYMRYVLAKAINGDEQMEVAGEARDGASAIAMFERLKPDVVTLDVEMEGMDGLETLGELMKRGPARVVMVSSHTGTGSEATLRALELGAIDFVQKPSGSDSLTMDTVKTEFVQKVKVAAGATAVAAVEKQTVEIRPKPAIVRHSKLKKIVIIGSSTGGPRALARVLPMLPADAPAGYVVVQHIPAGFSASLANRMNDASAVSVREATDGSVIEPGVVLVAPGDRHMIINAGGVVRLKDGEKVHGVRPSIDVTMKSAAPLYREMLIGVVLTGMGRDGTEGGAAIRANGGVMIAQSPETCVVDGMPASLAESGNADKVVPLEQIAEAIMGFALNGK